MSADDPEITIEQPTDSEPDRHQVRYGVDLAVTVTSDHNFYAGFAKNLSEGGIFVATHIVHPVGTQFNLSIHLDDGDPQVVRGKGEVRWIRAKDGDEPAGLGIQFTSVEGDGQDRIERFLAQRNPIVLGDAVERSDHPDTLTEGGVGGGDRHIRGLSEPPEPRSQPAERDAPEREVDEEG